MKIMSCYPTLSSGSLSFSIYTVKRKKKKRPKNRVTIGFSMRLYGGKRTTTGGRPSPFGLPGGSRKGLAPPPHSLHN